jgi:hypothetical protein
MMTYNLYRRSNAAQRRLANGDQPFRMSIFEGFHIGTHIPPHQGIAVTTYIAIWQAGSEP